jgi:hypothetical protein
MGPVSNRIVNARISPIPGTVLSKCSSGLERMWRNTTRSRHWIWTLSNAGYADYW